MRGGVVASGVGLMVVGVIFFMLSNTNVLAGTGGGTGGVVYSTGNQLFLVIGAVLGIVGFIVLIAGLAASKKEKPLSPPTWGVQPSATLKESETLVICPECKERVSSKSKFCPECATNLRPKKKSDEVKIETPKSKLPLVVVEEKSETSTPSIRKAKPKFCIRCGTELPTDADFCNECGKKTTI